MRIKLKQATLLVASVIFIITIFCKIIRNQDEIKNTVEIKNKDEIKNIKSPKTSKYHVLPILIITHDRQKAVISLISSLRTLIDDFQINIDNNTYFPVIISIDSGDKNIISKLRQHSDHVIIAPVPTYRNSDKSSYKYQQISRHYKFALESAFNFNENFTELIVLEDDLELAPDFLQYFYTLRNLLNVDDTIMTISAWNDNGVISSIPSNSQFMLHRTDFFPGLGWLMTKKLWLELSKKWPDVYWDDWLRHPDQMKNRVCIRPEWSRVSMSQWGKHGVSNGLFFNKYLSKIAHSTVSAKDWLNLNSSHINDLVKQNYDSLFNRKLKQCRSINGFTTYSTDQYKERNPFVWSPDESCEVLICKNSKDTIEILKKYDLMFDTRSDLYRTVYKSYVETYKDGRRIFIKTAT